MISDFYEDPHAVVKALGDLAYRGHDLMVFHVLDPAELDFPYEQAGAFMDLETGEEVPVLPRKARERYQELVSGHVETLREGMREHRIDYVLLDTSIPLDYALFRYLSERERLSRTR